MAEQVTEEQIQAWADEAEAGYDVEEPSRALPEIVTPSATPTLRHTHAVLQLPGWPMRWPHGPSVVQVVALSRNHEQLGGVVAGWDRFSRRVAP